MKLVSALVNIVFVFFTLSCQNSPEQTPTLANQEKKMPATKQANLERGVVAKTFTHAVANTTPYYLDGPQQARPADGNLSVGTKIKIIKDSGSYVLVETDNGVTAYVAFNDLLLIH
jgi:hypothetical protein